jgi:hypothetical protein
VITAPAKNPWAIKFKPGDDRICVLSEVVSVLFGEVVSVCQFYLFAVEKQNLQLLLLPFTYPFP